MRISIFGLGYVGTVTAACLASAGHRVHGVDVDPNKLALLASGRSPVTEPGLDELVQRVCADGRLTVGSDAAAAVHQSDLSIVCVATPSRRNGSLDTRYLERVAGDIGSALRTTSVYHVVAIRSTLLPGLLDARVIPALEAASGRTVGVDLGVCVSPEFLREGSAIDDFQAPPFTIVGETDTRAGDALLAAYSHLAAPVYRVPPEAAAMVKYASNAFHAVKVAFANEIGAFCAESGIDPAPVMEIFCQDRILNVSPRYLRPGFAFGGSCLPKDLRALTYAAHSADLTLPLLDSVLPSNDAVISRAVERVLTHGRPRVALIGLSFKPGSDDLRESPLVRLAEALIGKGVRLQVFDPDVLLGRVFGRNLAYIQETIPHVGELLTADLPGLLADAELIIVGKTVQEFEAVRPSLRPGQRLLDLVRPSGTPAAPTPAITE